LFRSSGKLQQLTQLAEYYLTTHKDIFWLLQKLGAIFILVPILTGLGYGDCPAKEWETFEVAVVQAGCDYLTKDDAAVLAGTKARRRRRHLLPRQRQPSSAAQRKRRRMG
jgi:hypothetical protein